MIVIHSIACEEMLEREATKLLFLCLMSVLAPKPEDKIEEHCLAKHVLLDALRSYSDCLYQQGDWELPQPQHLMPLGPYLHYYFILSTLKSYLLHLR